MKKPFGKMEAAVLVNASAKLGIKGRLLLTGKAGFSVISFHIFSHAVHGILIQHNNAGFWTFHFAIVLGVHMSAENIHRMILGVLGILKAGFLVCILFFIFVVILYMSGQSFKLSGKYPSPGSPYQNRTGNLQQ